MHQRVVVVQIERFVGLHTALHERLCPPVILGVHLAFEGLGQLLIGGPYSVLPGAFVHVRVAVALTVVPRVVRPQAFVVRA